MRHATPSAKVRSGTRKNLPCTGWILWRAKFIAITQPAAAFHNGNYLNKWVLDLSYTSFWGGGIYNLTSDRDFVAVSAKYLF